MRSRAWFGSRLARAGLGLLLLALAATACGRIPDGAALHRAVLRNDLVQARSILERDPMSARMLDRDGLTALHFTAVRLRVAPGLAQPGGPETAEPRAADVRKTPGCGAQPRPTSYDWEDLRDAWARSHQAHLELTTTQDLAPMAELLIRYGAPVNAKARGREGMTPLHLAVLMGHMGVARALLAHGAKVDAADAFGATPLDVVSQSGNLAMVWLLLDHGADPRRRIRSFGVLRPFQDDTPLTLALVCDHVPVIAALLSRGADPNAAGKDGFRPLHLAESPVAASLLLEHGAQLSSRGYEGRTPLHQAAMRGRIGVAGLLLDRGADREAKDRFGQTPLLIAIRHRAPAAAELLIRRGADVNARSSDGQTPLLAAVDRDRGVAEMLLNSGADANAADQYGRTALH